MTSGKTVCFTIGLTMLLPLIAACAAVERSLPEKRHYMLDVSRGTEISSPEPGTVLEISQIRLSPQYEARGFVYRTSTLRYETDFNNEFLTAPGPMLTREVQEWLAGSGLFQHVLDATGRLQPTHILEGKVFALYGDYSDRQAPQAVMDVQFVLTQDLSGQNEIVFQKQYRKVIPIKESYPPGLVSAWNEALEQILEELETDLKSTLFQ